ncbi:hypothetical protein L484_022806 [Morus notabilis]|uniref:Uncharacterized protein n=1 Tax=Morus notabilis TaxID=981085 RepID=W9S544_9ROSA|nr:hypothetical protein L484_022806 [Morus notabilis]
MPPEGPKGWQSTVLILCLHWSKGRAVNLPTRSLDLLALGLHFVGEANENDDHDDGHPSHQRRGEKSTLRETDLSVTDIVARQRMLVADGASMSREERRTRWRLSVRI